MILTDLSQIALAAIHVDASAQDCARNPSDENIRFIKHFMLNSIRSNFMQHKGTYGHMVIAVDSNSWRREFFPNYKCQRRAEKAAKAAAGDSKINWEFVNQVVDQLVDDLTNHFPFAVVKVPGAEGDDVIGTLTKHISEAPTDDEEENIFGEKEPEKILILSSDQDNFQLHTYKTVRQYSPMGKKFIKPDGKPMHALLEKIVKGESGGSSDSIPNIRSADDFFILGEGRQKSITQIRLNEFFNANNPIDACLDDEERKNFIRNETLVSYKKIPAELQTDIITRYNEQVSKKHSKMGLMDYFTRNRMSNLLGAITDFYK